MFIKSDSNPDLDSTNTGIEKKFRDMDLSIKSDGTNSGTTIKLNGREIKDLRGFMLSLTPVGEEMSIYAEYTVARKGQTADGFAATATYRLSKADDGPESVIEKKAVDGDIETIEQYLEDLPTAVRESARNIIGAVRNTGEPKKKEEQTMPENKDGKETTKETPSAAPVVDVKEIASAVVSQLAEQGVSADGIKNAVLDQIAAERKAAEDAAAKEAQDHADKVAAGEELEFASEEEMLAAIATEANQEALIEAGDSTST